MNDPIFKSLNARALPWRGGGGMLKFRVDRRITGREDGSVQQIERLSGAADVL